LDVAWHPNNILLATVGSDSKCRVTSAFTKNIDRREDVADGTAFGSKLPFGTALKDFDASAWVHCVKFSASGNKIAFAGHDSTLTIIDCETESHVVHTVKHRFLPFVDLLFLTENSIVGVGHDCNPLLFQNQGGQWQFTAALDQKAGVKSGDGGAKEMWKAKTTMADGGGDRELTTKHQNCITCLKPFSNGPNYTAFSTTGLDGNIVIWQTKALEQSIQGVKII